MGAELLVVGVEVLWIAVEVLGMDVEILVVYWEIRNGISDIGIYLASMVPWLNSNAGIVNVVIWNCMIILPWCFYVLNDIWYFTLIINSNDFELIF